MGLGIVLNFIVVSLILVSLSTCPFRSLKKTKIEHVYDQKMMVTLALLGNSVLLNFTIELEIYWQQRWGAPPQKKNEYSIDLKFWQLLSHNYLLTLEFPWVKGRSSTEDHIDFFRVHSSCSLRQCFSVFTSKHHTKFIKNSRNYKNKKF